MCLFLYGYCLLRPRGGNKLLMNTFLYMSNKIMSYSSVKRGTFNLTKKQQNKTLQVNSKCSQMFEKTFKNCLKTFTCSI